MKYILLFLVTGTLVLMTGCATILTGTTQRLTIDSTPQGADIVIDGRLMGQTPADIRIDRNINAFIDNGRDIRLEKQGYVPDGYYLGTDLQPVAILNIFNPLFWAIDAATGAIMRYDSDYYNFKLIPDSNAAAPGGNAAATAAGEDNYEKLMKLVDLYEQGMISEEEFEAEKAKIYEKKRE